MISIKWKSSSFKVYLYATTTLAALVDKILDNLEELTRVDFSLHYGETATALCEINSDGTLLAFFFKTKYNTIIVKSKAVGFNKLKQTVIFNWAGIGEIIQERNHFENTHFENTQIDLENEVNSKVIEHALEDLKHKDKFYGPILDCLQNSVREYISTVLLACARITGNVKLVAELNVVGRKGTGPLDFAMHYNNFFLLTITEAKKDQLGQGVIQNVAQLVASREETYYNLTSVFNKRNYMSMASDIACVPSTGVASTGKEWVLIRYVLLPQPVVFQSYPISLPLVNGSPEELRKHFLSLLSKLLGAIEFQKRAVDERSFAANKAQRTDPNPNPISETIADG